MSALSIVLLCGTVSVVSFTLGVYEHARSVRRKMEHFSLKFLHELNRVNPDALASRYACNTVNGVTKIVVVDDQPLEMFQLDKE